VRVTCPGLGLSPGGLAKRNTVLSDAATTTAKEEITRPEVGQRITVRIDDVAFGGEGVGRVDGFVVFVPLVIEGETVEAEITEVKKSFARADLVKVVEPAESRVEPECSYFGDCGGCQYQHMAYEAQLAMKQKQIVALFERIGGFTGFSEGATTVSRRRNTQARRYSVSS